MNERIKELAEQAGLTWNVQPMHFTNTSSPINFPVSANQELEKFAELIVQECANQCDLLLNNKMSSEWSRGTHDCSREIKKHFGVEE
jgi:hypothetical protein